MRRERIVCVELFLCCFASFMLGSEILTHSSYSCVLAFSGFSWLSEWARNQHSESRIIVSEMAMSLLNFIVAVSSNLTNNFRLGFSHLYALSTSSHRKWIPMARLRKTNLFLDVRESKLVALLLSRCDHKRSYNRACRRTLVVASFAERRRVLIGKHEVIMIKQCPLEDGCETSLDYHFKVFF